MSGEEHSHDADPPPSDDPASSQITLEHGPEQDAQLPANRQLQSQTSLQGRPVLQPGISQPDPPSDPESESEYRHQTCEDCGLRPGQYHALGSGMIVCDPCFFNPTSQSDQLPAMSAGPNQVSALPQARQDDMLATQTTGSIPMPSQSNPPGSPIGANPSIHLPVPADVLCHDCRLRPGIFQTAPGGMIVCDNCFFKWTGERATVGSIYNTPWFESRIHAILDKEPGLFIRYLETRPAVRDVIALKFPRAGGLVQGAVNTANIGSGLAVQVPQQPSVPRFPQQPSAPQFPQQSFPPSYVPPGQNASFGGNFPASRNLSFGGNVPASQNATPRNISAPTAFGYGFLNPTGSEIEAGSPLAGLLQTATPPPQSTANLSSQSLANPPPQPRPSIIQAGRGPGPQSEDAEPPPPSGELENPVDCRNQIQ